MIQKYLDNAIKLAEDQGYKIGKIELKTMPIRGRKLGYASGASKGKTVKGKIVIDSRFATDGEQSEVENTVKHELAHLIAETINTKKKRVWHGDAWKDIHTSIGGSGERFYKGKFEKPENKGKTFKTLEELKQIKPTFPKENWERGTYRQWLERGYHVIKGQQGQLVVWGFVGNEYETEDGKTSEYGRASAVYFTPDQVESN